jgi:transcriptional regulator of aromatic amino acid metabolism
MLARGQFGLRHSRELARDEFYDRVIRRTIKVPPLRENADSIQEIARLLIEERCPDALKRKLGGLPQLSR